MPPFAIIAQPFIPLAMPPQVLLVALSVQSLLLVARTGCFQADPVLTHMMPWTAPIVQVTDTGLLEVTVIETEGLASRMKRDHVGRAPGKVSVYRKSEEALVRVRSLEPMEGWNPFTICSDFSRSGSDAGGSKTVAVWLSTDAVGNAHAIRISSLEQSDTDEVLEERNLPPDLSLVAGQHARVISDPKGGSAFVSFIRRGIDSKGGGALAVARVTKESVKMFEFEGDKDFVGNDLRPIGICRVTEGQSELLVVACSSPKRVHLLLLTSQLALVDKVSFNAHQVKLISSSPGDGSQLMVVPIAEQRNSDGGLMRMGQVATVADGKIRLKTLLLQGVSELSTGPFSIDWLMSTEHDDGGEYVALIASPWNMTVARLRPVGLQGDAVILKAVASTWISREDTLLDGRLSATVVAKNKRWLVAAPTGHVFLGGDGPRSDLRVIDISIPPADLLPNDGLSAVVYKIMDR